MNRLILITGLVGTQKYRFAQNLVNYLNETKEPTVLVSMHEKFVEIANTQSFTTTDEYIDCMHKATDEIIEQVRESFDADNTVVCVGEFDRESIDKIAASVSGLASICIALDTDNYDALHAHIMNILASETMDFPEICQLYCQDAFKLDDGYLLRIVEEFDDDFFKDEDIIRIPNIARSDTAFYAISQLVKLYHNRNPTMITD